MRKHILSVALLLGSFVFLAAQKINYEPSLEKARTIARKQQQPVAILMTIEPPVPSPRFMRGLDDTAVISKFNSSFVNFKVAREDTAISQKIIRAYNIYRFPAFIFLDAKGGLMFTDIAFVSSPEQLMAAANKAIAASKEKSLVDYDSIYKAGNKSTTFLKAYILRRRTAGITDNANLIEEYVSGLSVADLNSYAEVLFILKAGPLADSNAHKLAYTNKHIVDSIFSTEPLADRVAMNNATITNTMNNAIATSNIARATTAANFTRSSWKNDYAEGQKNWYIKMLQYYNGVKDTASYLQMAVNFYDRYYMSITADSLKRRDSLNFETAKNKARQNGVMSAPDSAGRRTFSFVFPKSSFATELNTIAWNFYLMAGNNNDYLVKAMLWSRRSIELDPKAAFYDTYAHLLYRLKFYDEAESMQKKAIESGKADKNTIKIFQDEYEKIKKRTL